MESWFRHFWVSLSVHKARTLRNYFTAFLYPPLQKQCYCKFLPDQFFWVSKAHASITPLVLLYGRWHCAYLTGTSGVNVYSSYKKLNLLKYYSWELRKNMEVGNDNPTYEKLKTQEKLPVPDSYFKAVVFKLCSGKLPNSLETYDVVFNRISHIIPPKKYRLLYHLCH